MSTVVEILIAIAAALAITLGSGLVLMAAAIGIAILQHRLQRHRARALTGQRLRSDHMRIKARMARLARPTLLLTPAREPGFSKLGGDPELPTGVDWPTGANGPAAFLAQIDLGAFQRHAPLAWLPTHGRLYAFWNDEDRGAADLVRILYSTETPGRPAPPPATAKMPFSERRVAFETYSSIPSLDWLGIDVAEIDVDTDELDELAEAPSKAFGDELQHRIGGYPCELQDEQMAISCELVRRGLSPQQMEAEITPAITRAARQWRLLLQIDSDPALKMNWGDGGRLYVFVREKDALAGDFSQTVTICQTY